MDKVVFEALFGTTLDLFLRIYENASSEQLFIFYGFLTDYSGIFFEKYIDKSRSL